MASDGTLSGTVTGTRGTANIFIGYVSADKFSFIISLPINGSPTDVKFSWNIRWENHERVHQRYWDTHLNSQERSRAVRRRWREVRNEGMDEGRNRRS